MARNWKAPMQWNNEGSEPSSTLKQSGFAGGYKPPATIFNYFFNRTKQCVEELQTVVDSVDGAKVDKVDGKGLSTNDYTTTEKNSLNTHVASKSNPHKVTKAQIGLGNVNNTSDADKPVSTAQQTAITAVENKIVGKSLAGQSVQPTKDTTVTAGEGAEIFNDTRARAYTSSGDPSQGNVASGKHAHAEGSCTTASGTYSHAEGYGATASGYDSHAEGVNTTASGDDSHAEGGETKASGTYSHAEGSETTASGECSHAEGQVTEASGTYSHAEGYRAKASGYGSHAEGGETKASGYGSHAEGDNTEASGDCSHAEGEFTEASGDYSHAEGVNTTASGSTSHAEGGGTTASGSTSHAEGSGTRASGDYSHAEGINTRASGKASHASGTSTTAKDYQFVTGKYSTEKDGCTTDGAADSGSQSASHTIFIVGNGTDKTTSNAFRITADGQCRGTKAFVGSGADFAEYFEWVDGNPNDEDRRGRFVTLDGEKIKLANDGDYILGIVSASGAFIGNSQSEDWHGKHLKDVYGDWLTQEVTIPESTDETGKVIPEHTSVQYVVNPDFNPETEYIAREFRKEWSPVGMLGQVVVVDDGTCTVNGYCKPSANGIGTAADSGYRVLKRIDNTHVKVLVK